MKKIILFILIAVSFSKDYIAVIDFKGIGVPKSEARALTQRVTTELIKINEYAVLERSQIRRILKEQKFQNSGACSDISCAVDVGKVIGAKYVVLGTVSRFGNTYTLDARFVDVESSESIRSGDYTTSKAIDNLLLQGVKSIVKQLVGDESGDAVTQDLEDFDSKPKVWKTEDYISYFRIGLDLEGSMTDYDITLPLGSLGGSPKTGLTLGYEYASPNGFGFGVDFQIFRAFDRTEESSGDFRYSSLYAIWNSTFSNGFSLFSKAGFSSLDQDFPISGNFDLPNSHNIFGEVVDTGVYFSFGFRRPISDAMHMECGFSVNAITQESTQTEHTYSRPYIGLSFLF